MMPEDGDSGGTLTSGLVDTAPAVTSGSSTFAHGEMVAGRYRIVKLLAGGGMGEVYEAEDLLLRERLALKTIRGDAAHDDRMLERFKREIQLARKVTHPNVCRIFDVGFHRDRAFLTMELLLGETLDKRVRRNGRMSIVAAEPVVAQLAAGLEAAHRAGVIHRDFKSANVMLVDEENGTRAVITDFGLARAIAAPSSEMTGNGGIVGSPSYMAPEQVEGGPVTHATDVYSLGVVMYEMVTGKLPFTGDSPLSIAVSRLKHDPPPPRHHVPDLDAAWDRVIMKCLARKPEARFAGGVDLVRTLMPTRAGENSSEVIFGRRVRRGRRWPWVVGAAPVALAAIVAAVVALRPALSPAPANGMRSVAVLGFRNESGRSDSDWISKALAEMLATELAAGDKLRAVPGENVVRAKRELALEDADSYSKQTLGDLYDRLGSDLVLLGSYNVRGPKLRFELLVQDTQTGYTVARVTETGIDSDLVDLVSRSGARLREVLSVAPPSPGEEERVRMSQPGSTDVARLYSEGLARLRNVECAPARDLLAKAVAAGPEYALTRAWLAEALNCLGYAAEAREEAKKAMELGKGLTPKIQTVTEALHARMSGDWPRALDLYGKLFAAEPDNIDYGSALAHLQIKAKKLDDLRDTVAALRRAPLGDHMVVDLVEADVVREVEKDLPRAVEVLQRVEEKARRLNVPTMAGQAQLSSAELLIQLKDFDAAEQAALKGQKTFQIAKDPDGVAGAAVLVAVARRALGRLDEAKVAAEEGMRAAHSVGDSRRIPSLVNVTIELAETANELEDAARLLEDEEQEARRQNDRWLEAWMILRRARLALEKGDLSRARQLLERTRKVPQDTPRPSLLMSMAALRTLISEAEGDVVAARAAVEETMAALAKMEGVTNTGMMKALLARVSLAEGKDEEADELVRGALEELANTYDETMGTVVLADALLSRGRVEEAARIFAGAAERMSPAYPAFERMSFTIVEQRLLAASRKALDVAAARETLDDLGVKAAAQGYHYSSLQARLAAGELALRSGHQPAGRALLSLLVKEAKLRGFLAVAQRAARLVAQAG